MSSSAPLCMWCGEGSHPLAANKALITRSGYLPVLEGYEEEKQLFTRLWHSDERREAMQANIEKKQPEKRREHTVSDKNNHV